MDSLSCETGLSSPRREHNYQAAGYCVTYKWTEVIPFFKEKKKKKEFRSFLPGTD